MSRAAVVRFIRNVAKKRGLAFEAFESYHIPPMRQLRAVFATIPKDGWISTSELQDKLKDMWIAPDDILAKPDGDIVSQTNMYWALRLLTGLGLARVYNKKPRLYTRKLEREGPEQTISAYGSPMSFRAVLREYKYAKQLAAELGFVTPFEQSAKATGLMVAQYGIGVLKLLEVKGHKCIR